MLLQEIQQGGFAAAPGASNPDNDTGRFLCFGMNQRRCQPLDEPVALELVLVLAGDGSFRGRGSQHHTLSTRFSPGLSDCTTSLLPPMAVPLPKFWWKTRSPTAKSETVPMDLATNLPSMVTGRRGLLRAPRRRARVSPTWARRHASASPSASRAATSGMMPRHIPCRMNPLPCSVQGNQAILFS